MALFVHTEKLPQIGPPSPFLSLSNFLGGWIPPLAVIAYRASLYWISWVYGTGVVDHLNFWILELALVWAFFGVGLELTVPVLLRPEMGNLRTMTMRGISPCFLSLSCISGIYGDRCYSGLPNKGADWTGVTPCILWMMLRVVPCEPGMQPTSEDDVSLLGWCLWNNFPTSAETCMLCGSFQCFGSGPLAVFYITYYSAVIIFLYEY